MLNLEKPKVAVD